MYPQDGENGDSKIVKMQKQSCKKLSLLHIMCCFQGKVNKKKLYIGEIDRLMCQLSPFIIFYNYLVTIEDYSLSGIKKYTDKISDIYRNHSDYCN